MNIFSLDSKFNQVMSRVFDLMVLNFTFILLCAPVITIGANITAMYYVTLKMAKNEDVYPFRSYWKSFRANFRQATGIWLIFLLLFLVLGADMYFSNYIEGAMQYVRYAFWTMMVVVIMFMSYVFPVLSRFDNTIRQTIKNSALMSIRHLPWSIVIVLLNLSPFLLFTFGNSFIAAWVPFLLITLGFSAIALANSWIFANRIFPWYMPSEEETAEEAADAAEEDAMIDALETQRVFQAMRNGEAVTLPETDGDAESAGPDPSDPTKSAE